MIELTCYIFGICTAWSWRNAIRYSIYNILGISYSTYSDASSNYNVVITYWSYILIFQFFVAWLNTYLRLNKKIDFDFIQQQTLKDNKKLLTYALMYKNLQIIVGLQWYDVIVETSALVSDDTIKICILWSLVVLLILYCVIAEFYWNKYFYGFQIMYRFIFDQYYDDKEINVIESIKAIANEPDKVKDKEGITGHDDINGETKENATNGDEDKTSPGDKNTGDEGDETAKLRKKENYWYVFWKEFIDLFLYAISIGALFSLIYTLRETFLLLLYDTTSDYSTSDDSTTDDSTEYETQSKYIIILWSFWFVIILIVVIIVTYLSSLVEKSKQRRQELLKKLNIQASQYFEISVDDLAEAV